MDSVKIYTRKDFVLFNENANTFHVKYYQPAIEKLAYHIPHVCILGTNHIGKTRREALEKGQSDYDVKLRRDYAERLTTALIHQIQSQHFGGKNTLSMEGIALEYIASNTGTEPCVEFFHTCQMIVIKMLPPLLHICLI